MADVLLHHRGAPGTTAVTKYNAPQEVPQSAWHARQMKKEWTRKFKGDAALKRKKINKQIKDLLAQRKRVKHSAKSKIRDKHLEIDTVYRTQGKGFQWSDLAKKIPWKKQRGRPLGSITARPRHDDYIDTDAYIAHEEPRHLTQGHTVVTTERPMPVSTMLPPITRPVALLPTAPVRILEPSRQLMPPVTRTPVPMLPPSAMKQVGPPANRQRPEIGNHIRGLLPAPGQTTVRLKMKNIEKKLNKK